MFFLPSKLNEFRTSNLGVRSVRFAPLTGNVLWVGGGGKSWGNVGSGTAPSADTVLGAGVAAGRTFGPVTEHPPGSPKLQSTRKLDSKKIFLLKMIYYQIACPHLSIDGHLFVEDLLGIGALLEGTATYYPPPLVSCVGG